MNTKPFVVQKAMTKMSDAKRPTITAITHSPSPLVITLCFSSDTTSCLKTARGERENNNLVDCIDFK